MVKYLARILSWIYQVTNSESLRKHFRFYYQKRRLKHLGNETRFWSNVIIHSPNNVTIGFKSGIGDNVVIWGAGGVNIEDNVLIAANSVITSQSHDVDALQYNNSLVMKSIHIHQNVWIGANVTVLPGVTIHKNSIIGAGSVVTHDIPENSIAVGVPAKVIKNLDIK